MAKNISTELSKRFMNGLQAYNLSYEMIEKGDFKYCGGREKRHLNYFKVCFPDKKVPDNLPEYRDTCICGHRIRENCYITDGSQILVLGNCCIRRFVPKCGRTCEKCGASHKNRKNNLCNDCRNYTQCVDCKKKIDSKYVRCYGCNFK